MSEYRYQWAGGFSPGVSPDVAAAEMKRLEEKYGAVSPAILVEESRPKDAPLHPAFTWDAEAAAYAHQLSQARACISRLRVVVQVGAKPAPVRVSLRVIESEETLHQYMPLVDVRNDADKRREFLLAEIDRIASLLERTASFPEMGPIRMAITHTRISVSQGFSDLATAAD